MYSNCLKAAKCDGLRQLLEQLLLTDVTSFRYPGRNIHRLHLQLHGLLNFGVFFNPLQQELICRLREPLYF